MIFQHNSKQAWKSSHILRVEIKAVQWLPKAMTQTFAESYFFSVMWHDDIFHAVLKAICQNDKHMAVQTYFPLSVIVHCGNANKLYY